LGGGGTSSSACSQRRALTAQQLRLWHLQAVRFGGGDDAHTRRQEARSRQRRCTATAPLSTADDARGDDTYEDDDVEEAQDELQKVNATADDARGDDSYEDDDK